MFSFTFRAALCAILVAAPNALAQSGTLYTPGSHRYDFTSTVHREQEHLGTKQSIEIRTIQQVSLDIARARGDTLAFSITLDSSSSATSEGAELPNLNGLKGIGIRGSVSPLGRVHGYEPIRPLDDEIVRDFQIGMSRMLPVFPKGTRTGTSWADTNVTAVNRDGSDLRTTTVITSTILPDTVYEGQPTIRVERRYAQRMSGTGAQLGETMTFEGTGSGTGMYYISRAGVYLGSTEQITSNMRLTLRPSELSIPVRQTVTSTVKRLPPRAPR